ncbi:MAG: type II 3-dehydroquinate dehydratase [Clostridia bacterium]|nr:type II 3-dehydroquinate dehydratase [Clostridia bacterium]
MKIYILNGPNLNLLGVREPGIYGDESYDALVGRIEQYCRERGVEVCCLQSNHEGALVDYIHQGFFEKIDGIVINPGAYTHTSIALLDAVKATSIPTVEVHISDVSAREDFRQVSYIRAACIGTVSGHGTAGYLEAIDLLLSYKGGAK